MIEAGLEIHHGDEMYWQLHEILDWMEEQKRLWKTLSKTDAISNATPYASSYSRSSSRQSTTSPSSPSPSSSPSASSRPPPSSDYIPSLSDFVPPRSSSRSASRSSASSTPSPHSSIPFAVLPSNPSSSPHPPLTAASLLSFPSPQSPEGEQAYLNYVRMADLVEQTVTNHLNKVGHLFTFTSHLVLFCIFFLFLLVLSRSSPSRSICLPLFFDLLSDLVFLSSSLTNSFKVCSCR
jgi:hypothetical protein